MRIVSYSDCLMNIYRKDVLFFVIQTAKGRIIKSIETDSLEKARVEYFRHVLKKYGVIRSDEDKELFDFHYFKLTKSNPWNIRRDNRLLAIGTELGDIVDITPSLAVLKKIFGWRR